MPAEHLANRWSYQNWGKKRPDDTNLIKAIMEDSDDHTIKWTCDLRKMLKFLISEGLH